MDTLLFLGFALAYLALLLRGIRLAMRHGWWTPANLPLLVLAALVYDNLVIGADRFIGDGPLLEGLNLARFWIHAFVTPVLVAWALHTLRRRRADDHRQRRRAARLDHGLQGLPGPAGPRGLRVHPEITARSRGRATSRERVPARGRGPWARLGTWRHAPSS